MGYHSEHNTAQDERRNKIIAAVVTCVVTLLVGAALYVLKIYYEPEPEFPPKPESEILFGGEYVMLGNFAATPDASLAANTAADEPLQESFDMTDAGAEDASSQVISSEIESPAVVEKREEKKGPTKEELEQIEREKKRKELAAKINSRVKNMSTGKSAGSAGDPNGAADASTLNGTASFSLKGRSAEYFGRASSGVDGKIIIEVRVNPKGVVTQATYKGGSGSAAASMAVRRSCEQASMQSRFNVAEVANDQIGTITWHFE